MRVTNIDVRVLADKVRHNIQVANIEGVDDFTVSDYPTARGEVRRLQKEFEAKGYKVVVTTSAVIPT